MEAGSAGHSHSLAKRSIGFWEALAMSIEAMGPPAEGS